MMLVIQTQHYENYGAHDWDGTGQCPQYWKAKGGCEYKVVGFKAHLPSLADSAEATVTILRGRIEESSEYFRCTIVDWSIQSDTYLSWFEKSQLDYEGEVAHSEPIIEYTTIGPPLWASGGV
jgi:hypothetical protein